MSPFIVLREHTEPIVFMTILSLLFMKLKWWINASVLAVKAVKRITLKSRLGVTITTRKKYRLAVVSTREFKLDSLLKLILRRGFLIFHGTTLNESENENENESGRKMIWPLRDVDADFYKKGFYYMFSGTYLSPDWLRDPR